MSYSRYLKTIQPSLSITFLASIAMELIIQTVWFHLKMKLEEEPDELRKNLTIKESALNGSCVRG